MKKKSILVCLKSLRRAGTEVACLNLLRTIDYSKYSVTMLLYETEGELLHELPKEVEVCQLTFKNEDLCRELYDAFYAGRVVKGVTAKIVDIAIRVMDKLKPNRNHRYSFMLKNAIWNRRNYDYILDFQGYGYFMTAFVSGNGFRGKKLTWIHDENVDWSSYVGDYLDGFDYYCGVSKACAKALKDRYPKYSDQMCVFYNILDTKRIINRSEETIAEISELKTIPSFVTVGRYEDQKGYPHAIRAAKRLKDDGYKFVWFCIGMGSKETEIKQLAAEIEVDDCIKFVGERSNPYPYIKNCMIYVQPSRNEGYGIAIAEARILKKCIVATDLECVKEQITDKENGYLIPYDADALAEKLKELLDHSDLRTKVEKKLAEELELIGNKPIYFRYKE